MEVRIDKSELRQPMPEKRENSIVSKFLNERLLDFQDILLFSSSSYVSRAPIDDLYVSMPTNLSIDVLIKSGQIVEIVEKTNDAGELYGKYNKTYGNSVSYNYVKSQMLLAKLLNNIRTGKEYFYPEIKERPLVISPPWTDGLKENYWVLSIGDVVTIYDRVVLLGGPGSGKSTSLRYLTLRLIRNVLHLPYASEELLTNALFEKKYIPIYVEIRDFSKWLSLRNKSSLDLLDLKEYFFSLLSSNELIDNKELLWQELKQNNILFIFDGLDESASISTDKQIVQGKLRGMTAHLRSEFKSLKIVFSSRSGEYVDYQMPHYKLVELTPMHQYKTRELVQRIYKYHGVLYDDSKISNFIIGMQHHGLKEDITGNPLLLSLMVAIAMDTSDDDFSLPKQKSQILFEGIRLLIRRWYVNEDRPDFFKKYTDDEILKKLKRFAFGTNENGLIDVNELLDFMQADYSNATSILDYLLRRAGLIIKKGSNYEFAHKSFRSYLAASFVVESSECTKYLTTDNRSRFKREREEAILVVDILFDSIKNEERNDGAISQLWSIVTLLVYSCSHNEWDIWLAGTIIARRDFLLLRVENPLKEVVITELRSLLLNVYLKREKFKNQDLDTSKRLECGEILGQLGDLRDGVGNKDGLPQIFWCSFPSGVCNYGIDDFIQSTVRNTSWGKECDFSRETPLQHVYLDEFQISKYPITVSQFKQFLEATDGYKNPIWYEWSKVSRNFYSSKIKNSKFDFPRNASVDNYPATDISFIDAIAFCKWLSFKTGDNIRLPSDVEWEYVAKSNNSIFTWGNEYDKEKCNDLSSSIGHVCPVGSFSDDDIREDFPIDLSGNIWEWTQSFYTESHMFDKNNAIIDTDHNEELDENTLIAERGGCYLSGPNSLRVSFRGRDPITSRADRQGFRIVKQISEYSGEIQKTPDNQQALTGIKAVQERSGYGPHVNIGDRVKIWYEVRKNGIRVQEGRCEIKLGNGKVHPFIENELYNKRVAVYVVIEKKGIDCFGDRIYCGVSPNDVLKFDVFILDLFE